MSIIITNIGACRGKDKNICTYTLKINRKVLATFTHKQSDGLSECLRKAAKAYEEAMCFRLVEVYKDSSGT
jgi:hypothetical protein